MSFSTNALDDRVRRILVDSLYLNPSSLAIGALVGVTTSAVTAHDAHNHTITLIAAIVATVAILRVVVAYSLPYRKQGTVRLLELIFEFGAFSYALALGVLAAACIALNAPPVNQLMMLTAAVAYGAGISARNAGRLPIAIGQLLLAVTPACLVLISRPSIASRVLAVSMGLFVLAMVSIALNVFKV